MNSRKGFTLLELLMVCAIIGILGSLGVLSLRAAVREARLSEGSAQLAADLKRARSSAQRFNQGSTLTFNGTPATSYTLTINGQNTTRTLPANVRVTPSASAGTITYNAPFGEVEATNLTLTVSLQGLGKMFEIKVLGTTGKVYTQKKAGT